MSVILNLPCERNQKGGPVGHVMINRSNGTLPLILSIFAIVLGAANLALYFSGKVVMPGTGQTTAKDSQPPCLENAAMMSPGPGFAQSMARAVADANAGTITEIHFLPGEYEMPGGLVFEKRFGQGGLRISGSGAGFTRLVFNAQPTAILVRLDSDIQDSASSPTFCIEGVSLLARGKCGAAVQLERLDPTRKGGVAEKRFSNLAIEGMGGSWDMGIKVTDLTFCSFRDVTLRPQNPDGTGIFIAGQNSPVDHHLNGIRILGCHTGIKVGGTVEGVYVQQSTIIGIDIGIDWDTDGHEPLLTVTGSHISARSACIRANNLLQPVIIGNLLYQSGVNDSWHGIEFCSKRATGYDLLQISNNTLHGNPAHKGENTGIEVNSASDGVLNGNLFSAVDTGIRLGEDAAGIMPAGNVFRATGKELVREGSTKPDS